MEDALLSPVSFALLTGAGLANMADADSTSKVYVHTTFDLPILDGGIVKIDLDTAGDNHDIYFDESTAPIFGMILDNAGAGVVPVQLNKISGVEPNCKVYTITKDTPLEMSFTEASKYVGKTLRVDCYVQKTGGATEITIDAENFAGNYYVEASTLFRDEHTAKDMPAEIVLPNVKIQSNFTFSMANSGDPSTFTFTMDSFPDYTNFDKQHKVFAAIQIIGEENIYPANPDEEQTETCKPLEVKFDEAEAGASKWVTEYGDTDPGFDSALGTVYYTDLGDNLKVTIDRANLDFSGNLNRIENYGMYPPETQTGYYYPYTLILPDTMVGATLTNVLPDGNVKVLKFGSSDYETTAIEGKVIKNIVTAVNPENSVVTMVLRTPDNPLVDEERASMVMVEGKDTSENCTIYSFDFSKVHFE